MNPNEVRVGRWVLADGKAAIIFRVGPDKLLDRALKETVIPAGAVMIHLIDPKTGETAGDAVVAIAAVSRAQQDDIPAVRRPPAAAKS